MRRRRFLAPWGRPDVEQGVFGVNEESARALQELLGKPALYHCVSRVVNRDRVLGAEEKEYFVKLLRLYERFCRVRIWTHAVMSNHFHVLVEVPTRPDEPMTNEELVEHLRCLYTEEEVEGIRYELERRAALGPRAEEEYREQFLRRMYDLSAFMKIVKQRFTQWFNRKHKRTGTLWEERFRSMLVEDGRAARIVAAYIDLNPVRAGLVWDPKEYRWCGYAESLAGRRSAREGLHRVMFEHRSFHQGEKRAADETGSWDEVHRRYRLLLFHDGKAAGSEADGWKEGGTPQEGVRTFGNKKVEAVHAAGGKLAEHDLLRCRTRYLLDSVALGSKDFVERVFRLSRDWFGSARKKGARQVRGVETPLASLRDLQVRRFG